MAGVITISKLNQCSTGKYNLRDKFAKCLQFATMSITYKMLQNDPKDETALRMVAFMKTMGTARKGMRLGKSIELVVKFQAVMAKAGKMAPDDLALNIITNVGMFFRWGYDNLAFLEKAKALDKADYGVTSNKFRSISGLAYIILAVKGIIKTGAALAKAATSGDDDKKAKVQAYADYQAAYLELVARICGLINALHSAKWYVTSQGVQGVCGFVDAFINFRKEYMKLK